MHDGATVRANGAGRRLHSMCASQAGALVARRQPLGAPAVPSISDLSVPRRGPDCSARFDVRRIPHQDQATKSIWFSGDCRIPTVGMRTALRVNGSTGRAKQRAAGTEMLRERRTLTGAAHSLIDSQEATMHPTGAPALGLRDGHRDRPLLGRWVASAEISCSAIKFMFFRCIRSRALESSCALHTAVFDVNTYQSAGIYCATT